MGEMEMKIAETAAGFWASKWSNNIEIIRNKPT